MAKKKGFDPALIATLLQEISQLLPGLKPVSTQSRKTYDLYEVLTLSHVCRAAMDLNAKVALMDPDGVSAKGYLFRSSPGSLGDPNYKYTHAQIELPASAPLEVHLGIRVKGKSGVDHECDVAVLRKDEADIVRTTKRMPHYGALKLHAECKFWENPIPLHMGRGFLGLGLELGWQGSVLVMNQEVDSIRKLVTNRKFQTASVHLLPGDTGKTAQFIDLVKRRFERFMETSKV